MFLVRYGIWEELLATVEKFTNIHSLPFHNFSENFAYFSIFFELWSWDFMIHSYFAYVCHQILHILITKFQMVKMKKNHKITFFFLTKLNATYHKVIPNLERNMSFLLTNYKLIWDSKDTLLEYITIHTRWTKHTNKYKLTHFFGRVYIKN